jgi:hypothetical protein
MNIKMLAGAQLDFWVAKAAGLAAQRELPIPGEKYDPFGGKWHPLTFHPSTNWSHAGPLVANDWYVIENILVDWFGPDWAEEQNIVNSPLQWFMRAYVSSQFGEEVEDIVSGYA